MALVAAAATVMIERMRTDIRRTELVLNANSAFLYAQGSVIWAIDTLINNIKQAQPNKIIDHTPIVAPTEHQDGYAITAAIRDAQGLFNINNLSDTQYQAVFARLIQVVAPEINAEKAQNITFAAIDWISPSGRAAVFDEYYLKAKPPYRAPHRLMVSISELRLVYGMTPELFDKLAPHLIALPKPTQISVNNATPAVLMSLSPTMSLEGAKALAQACEKNPFPTVQAFLNYDLVKNNPIDTNKITVTSSYFLVQTNVKLGQQTLDLNTLLERAGQGNDVKVNILWQSMGTL